MSADKVGTVGEQPSVDTRKSGPVRSAGRFLGHPLVLPVVAVLLAVVLAVLVLMNHNRSSVEAARADAPTIVASHVSKLLSFTPSNVSSGLAEKRTWLTGDFLNDYTVLVTKTVGPGAIQGGVTAEATVVANAVQSATATRVEMVMFVNVVTSRTGAKVPQTQGSRIRVVADKVGGFWLIASLSPI